MDLATPGTAWHDETYRTYAVILGGVLAVAGTILAALTWGLRRDVRSIWVPYRSWWVMGPLVLATVLLGRVATVTLLTVLAVLGFREFARATGLATDKWMTATVSVLILALGVSALVPNPTTGQTGWFALFLSLPVFGIAVVLLIPILRNRAQGQLRVIALAILGFVYIGWMFVHLTFLAGRADGCGYLLYILFAVPLSDVSAFTVGRVLGRSGKHPLRAGISPSKTWEGAVGSLAVSMALPWAMRFSLPHFGPVPLILTGLIVGVGGQLGDLSLSVIKRDLGVKDMGSLIPGHGGVLDRIDSLIYAAPLFVHLVNFCDK